MVLRIAPTNAASLKLAKGRFYFFGSVFDEPEGRMGYIRDIKF